MRRATGATGTPVVLPFKAETLTAYEIGSKNRFLDERLQVNGDVFYYNYAGFQTATVDISPIPGVFYYTSFAVPVHAYGGELETRYQIAPTDRIALDVAYSNVYYVDKPALFAEFVAEDKLAPLTPAQASQIPLTVNISYDHIFDLPGGSSLTLHGDARYLSSHEGDLTAAQFQSGGEPYVHIKAAGIGDAGLTWRSPDSHYSVSGYVRNVTNNRYINNVLLGGSTQPFSFQQAQYDPRTYGVVLHLRF